MGFVKDDITIEERIQLFRQMIDPNRPHGLVTQLHRQEGVSRQFLYELRDKGLLALRAAFAPGEPGRKLKTTTIEVNHERVVRAIVTLAADGKISERDTQICLAEILLPRLHQWRPGPGRSRCCCLQRPLHPQVSP